MKDVVIHLTKCSYKSTVASIRIARWLSDLLDLQLIDSGGHVGDYRIVFIVNSGSAFCDFLPEVAEIVSRCKRMVWVQNDYTIYPPTQVRKVMNERPDLIVERWSTVPTYPERYSKLKIWTRLPLQTTEYINWNKLTYKDLPTRPVLERGLFYYGAFRQDRAELFETYFGMEAEYPIIISASKKAEKKFFDLNFVINFVGPMKNLQEDIQRYECTLYIEDGESNDIYCSLANRFYECLGARIPILFDSNSRPTMETAGYNLEIDEIVDDSDDIGEILLFPDKLVGIASSQHKRWARDYVGELTESVLAAYGRVNK